MNLKTNKIYRIAFSLLFWGISFNSISQSGSQIARIEMQANHYFHSHEYHNALESFLILDSLNPNNPNYMLPIGICYLNTSYEEDKALKYFVMCLKEADKYPNALYYYTAKAYHLSHNLDEAIKYFDIYNACLKKNIKKNQSTIDKVNRELEMCKNGKELMANPVDLDIINMGPQINSIYPDYGAVLSADENELIFTSNRPNSIGGLKDPADGKYYEDLYISYKSKDGWSTPQNMGDSVNTKGHDASIALSADGQKLFLYRYSTDSGANSSGDLYMSELQGKTWTKAKALSSNVNSPGWEPSASLSADEKILFFASDRPGGYGGTDIYMARRLPNGEYAMPVNLGNKVNTSFDEDSPFIHSDGKTLYFSSSGHKTMGGFDIFVTTYDDKKLEWSEPKNVGYPISTAHDDIHFCWSADGRKIYFSSRRDDSYGDQDIYYAVIHKKEATEVLVMKGFVLDSLNQNPLSASITVTEKKSNDLVGVFTTNSSTGKFLIILPEGHYKIKIEAENHSVCEEVLDISELQGFEILNKNIILCTSPSLSK